MFEMRSFTSVMLVMLLTASLMLMWSNVGHAQFLGGRRTRKYRGPHQRRNRQRAIRAIPNDFIEGDSQLVSLIVSSIEKR